MTTNKPKNIVFYFDVDGTLTGDETGLIDRNSSLYDALLYALGPQNTIQKYLDLFWGTPDGYWNTPENDRQDSYAYGLFPGSMKNCFIYQSLLGSNGVFISKEKPVQLNDHHIKLSATHTPLADYVNTTLFDIRNSGARLYACSSGVDIAIKAFLEKYNIYEYFNDILAPTSDGTSHPKDKITFIQQTLDNDIPVFVGDGGSDFEAFQYCLEQGGYAFWIAGQDLSKGEKLLREYPNNFFIVDESFFQRIHSTTGNILDRMISASIAQSVRISV